MLSSNLESHGVVKDAKEVQVFFSCEKITSIMAKNKGGGGIEIAC